MNSLIIGVLAALAVVVPSTVQAQRFHPYSCEWVSEVTANAVIRFSSINGVGTFNGVLFYEGRRLMAFQEGQSQGYSSNWWRSPDQKGKSGAVVVFSGNQAVRGTPGLWRGDDRRNGVQRVLIVGLGRSLWYGRDFSWRDEPTLLAAAEGFWRTSPGCRLM